MKTFLIIMPLMLFVLHLHCLCAQEPLHQAMLSSYSSHDVLARGIRYEMNGPVEAIALLHDGKGFAACYRERRTATNGCVLDIRSTNELIENEARRTIFLETPSVDAFCFSDMTDRCCTCSHDRANSRFECAIWRLSDGERLNRISGDLKSSEDYGVVWASPRKCFVLWYGQNVVVLKQGGEVEMRHTFTSPVKGVVTSQVEEQVYVLDNMMQISCLNTGRAGVNAEWGRKWAAKYGSTKWSYSCGSVGCVFAFDAPQRRVILCDFDSFKCTSIVVEVEGRRPVTDVKIDATAKWACVRSGPWLRLYEMKGGTLESAFLVNAFSPYIAFDVQSNDATVVFQPMPPRTEEGGEAIPRKKRVQ